VKYDLAIIGGGISGLSTAILCAKRGWKVAVFEKDEYPKHKVCGEYISNESREFLTNLGLPIDEMNLPSISTFVLTTQYGTSSSCTLETGGFGLSRYAFDQLLATKAQQLGVSLFQNTRIKSTDGTAETGFNITDTKGESYHSRLIVGAWGRSNALDHSKPITNTEAWVGIKYHVEKGPDADTIEIHAFEDGYCGISEVEDGKFCLCYLAKAKGLKAFKGDIEAFEQAILTKNPFLKKRLASNKIIGPITTSQFHFGVNQQKPPFPYLGDASGFIPPLTGNGMSLALRSSKAIAPNINAFLKEEITYDTLLQSQAAYTSNYLKTRVNRGIILQNLLFLKPAFLNKWMMHAFAISPFALRIMTRLAVGKKL
jgi:menaquinone-9 beta-reductase